MQVAMIQMQVVAGRVSQNRQHGFDLVRQAAQTADIICLPEVWNIGYGLGKVKELAETETGPTLLGLAEIAQGKKVYIVAGSIPYRHEQNIYNGSFVLSPEGNIIADYQKIHLFSMFKEETYFAKGNKRTVFPLKEAKAGLAICYDLRFPEFFRAMALEGADIIFVPAEWPEARGEHWRVLCQARAIENQVFICAVNCVGHHGNHVFYGHSMFISPEGRIIAEGCDQEEIVYAEFDVKEVNIAKKSMSIINDRRRELY